MKRKTKQIVTSLLAVAAVSVAIAGTVFYIEWSDRKVPNFSRSQELYVYPGTPVMKVVSELSDSGNVLRAGSLRRALKHEQMFSDTATVQPGHYVVDETMTSYYVVRMLSRGWQTPVRLTISGAVRSHGAIASKVSRQMMVDSASVDKALKDEKLLEKYGFTPANVFAMVIPDTYEIYWTEPVEEILSMLHKAWKQFWTVDNDAKAKALGLSRMEVSTLASIVAGETLHVPEMPTIAGVYLNRLKTGMKLQADPTVAYCFDYKLNRILLKHLQVDSPYNTYKHVGLPPGPICSPSKACLNAVLNPAKHNYVFFCASPSFDGTHRFAADYSTHLRNAREFQSALNRRNAARKAENSNRK